MASSKKKAAVESSPAKQQKVKVEMVNIFSTTYGYWRYWVKNILAEGGITKFRFVKEADSYNGKISVAKSEVDKAKKVLAEYKTNNAATVEMWR